MAFARRRQAQEGSCIEAAWFGFQRAQQGGCAVCRQAANRRRGVQRQHQAQEIRVFAQAGGDGVCRCARPRRWRTTGSLGCGSSQVKGSDGAADGLHHHRVFVAVLQRSQQFVGTVRGARAGQGLRRHLPPLHLNQRLRRGAQPGLAAAAPGITHTARVTFAQSGQQRRRRGGLCKVHTAPRRASTTLTSSPCRMRCTAEPTARA